MTTLEQWAKALGQSELKHAVKTLRRKCRRRMFLEGLNGRMLDAAEQEAHARGLKIK